MHISYRLILIWLCLSLSIAIFTPAPTHAQTLTDCTFESLKSLIHEKTTAITLEIDCDTPIIFTEAIRITAPLTLSGGGIAIFERGMGDGWRWLHIEEDVTASIDGVRFERIGVVNWGNLTISQSVFVNIPDGAVFNGGGILTITDTFFYNNHADRGGAIYNAGTMSIANSRFWRNQAQSRGGAILNKYRMTITNSEFYDNFADEKYGRGFGGAIDNNGYLTVADSAFFNNRANGNGGAIRNRGELNISDTSFRLNRAWLGGAIQSEGILHITESLFTDNTAYHAGGAISSMFALTLITDNQFLRNDAPYGGGIYAIDTQAVIEANTFNDNHATQLGGALYFGELFSDEIATTITNNTLIRNAAPIGSAIFINESLIPSQTRIIHNTLHQNEGAGGALIIEQPSMIYHNLISGDGVQCGGASEQSVDETNLSNSPCGNAQIATDLMLNDADGMPAPNSPAINAYPTPCVLIDDQLGIPRPQNGGCDVGAIEIASSDWIMPTQAQSITLTTCTIETFTQAIQQVNLTGGDIILNCDEDTPIAFHHALPIKHDVSIRVERNANLDGLGQTSLFHVYYGATLTLSGVTLQHGFTNQIDRGGAITNDGDLIIHQSVFMNHSARFGGAVLNRGRAKISDSRLTNNQAMVSGGAIATHNYIVIENSELAFNHAEQDGGALIQFAWTEGDIHHNQFIGNSATNGGAFYAFFNPAYNQVASVTPDTQIVGLITDYLPQSPYPQGRNDEEPELVGYGNFIEITEVPIRVRYNLFEENSAQNGGAMYNLGWIALQENQFVRNHATQDGGALKTDGWFYQNTFWENDADYGGAVHGGVGWLNTFVGNHARVMGGAVYGGPNSQSTFVDNTAPLGGAIAEASAYHNLISGEGSQCENVNLNSAIDYPKGISDTFCHADYLLVDDLMLGKFDGVVVPLLADSPAIDKIPCRAYPGNIDQLGILRPQGEACDLGAVEFVP